MARRLLDEKGQGMVEMILAVVVITIALLALMASYDQAFFSLHSAARKTAAASLAEQQLELYNALPFASVGLSSSLLSTAESSDSFYSTDKSALGVTGTDVVNSSCTTTVAQCEPVQLNVTGSDGKKYRVETFVLDVSQTLTCQGQTTSCGTTTERDVTVIVRDPNVSGTPKIYTATAAFDSGPRSS